MTELEVTRRLAAILAADIVGYTRLMEQDSDGTVAAWHAARADVIDPHVSAYTGRIVKHTGDGFIAEFSTAEAAVNCALELQAGLANSSLNFRIGINIGDIMDDGEDIHGEGVNVAARLEGLAEPGGIYISGMVFEAVRNRIDADFKDLGKKTVKHVSAPVQVYSVSNTEPASAPVKEPETTAVPQQDVRFCQAPDGVTIAYATVGRGPPLVKAPNLMHHLEYDWQNPVWGHLLRALSANHTLLRFDQRSNGLSDWDVADISFDSMIGDMATVVDAAGFERFPLIGFSQGCACSIAYAARYPEKVNKLILFGGFYKGLTASGREADRQRADMERHMILEGWGQDNPAFRQFFTTRFMPDASKDQMDWFNELQRLTISPENAVRLTEINMSIDVKHLLAEISVPTLVLHCKDDSVVPFEAGRKMAARIPNARFVTLDSRNHLILEDEPAWPHFIDEVTKFLGEG
jgi:class 3 adenylate cyclase/pimeloyl-ACP methyl ester carboxylesterase